MNKKINISIVGTGLMGLQHIKAISKSKKANLHSILDISNNAKNLSKKYKIPLYSNVEELLKSNYKVVVIDRLSFDANSLDSIKNDSSLIKEANDTMENCYIITIENEDYTIGKIIEFYLYNKYFLEKKQLNFVGFLKKHPHDTNSTIKVSFKNLISKDELIYIIEEAVNYGILLYNNIKT